MIHRKKLLVYAVSILILIGIAFISLPFILSLNPNTKAIANVPTFSINEVPVGGVGVFDEGAIAVIVARSADQIFTIFWASQRELRFGTHYILFPGALECAGFRVNDQRILCTGVHDPEPEWDIDGMPSEAAPKWVPPLDLMEYSVSNGLVSYGQGAKP